MCRYLTLRADLVQRVLLSSPCRARRIEVALDQALQFPRVQGAPPPGSCFACPSGDPFGPLSDLKLLGRRWWLLCVSLWLAVRQFNGLADINLYDGQVLLDRVT